MPKTLLSINFSGEGSFLLNVDPEIQELVMRITTNDKSHKLKLNYVCVICRRVIKTWREDRNLKGELDL